MVAGCAASVLSLVAESLQETNRLTEAPSVVSWMMFFNFIIMYSDTGYDGK